MEGAMGESVKHIRSPRSLPSDHASPAAVITCHSLSTPRIFDLILVVDWQIARRSPKYHNCMRERRNRMIEISPIGEISCSCSIMIQECTNEQSAADSAASGANDTWMHRKHCRVDSQLCTTLNCDIDRSNVRHSSAVRLAAKCRYQAGFEVWARVITKPLFCTLQSKPTQQSSYYAHRIRFHADTDIANL